MRSWQSILYVSRGIQDDAEGVKTALALAGDERAELRIVVEYPGIPEELREYRQGYEASLATRMKETLEKARAALGLQEDSIRVAVEIEGGSLPAVRIIRRVLRAPHDLAAKCAEGREAGRGFRAVDMDLLRKCPCPVLLTRSMPSSRGDVHVAVAIDPESDEPVGRDLAIRLLQRARSLADRASGTLRVVACWEYVFEDFLTHNHLMRVSDEELHSTLERVRSRHRTLLDQLIEESGIGGSIEVSHLRGEPDVKIPQWIEESKTSLLVMGTVARTGIEGFIIGNTAENIFQKLGCSLLALKPNGFVSPITAY